MSRMLEINMAILNCAEYNQEKLAAYWGPPKSPAEALKWKLELGVCECARILICFEKCQWGKFDKGPSPKRLRKTLCRLINNSNETTDEKRVSELKRGIKNAVSYLKEQIKKNSIKSKTLQLIEKKLNKLLEANEQI